MRLEQGQVFGCFNSRSQGGLSQFSSYCACPSDFQLIGNQSSFGQGALGFEASMSLKQFDQKAEALNQSGGQDGWGYGGGGERGDEHWCFFFLFLVFLS